MMAQQSPEDACEATSAAVMEPWTCPTSNARKSTLKGVVTRAMSVVSPDGGGLDLRLGYCKERSPMRS